MKTKRFFSFNKISILVIFAVLLSNSTNAQVTKAHSISEYVNKVDSIIIVLEKVHKLAENQYERTYNKQYINVLDQEIELIRLFKVASKNIKYLENFESKITEKNNIGLILFGTRNIKVLKAIKNIKWLTKTFILMKDIILIDGSLSNDQMVNDIPELKFPYDIKKLKRIYYWGYRSKLVKKIKQN